MARIYLLVVGLEFIQPEHDSRIHCQINEILLHRCEPVNYLLCKFLVAHMSEILDAAIGANCLCQRVDHIVRIGVHGIFIAW